MALTQGHLALEKVSLHDNLVHNHVYVYISDVNVAFKYAIHRMYQYSPLGDSSGSNISVRSGVIKGVTL